MEKKKREIERERDRPTFRSSLKMYKTFLAQGLCTDSLWAGLGLEAMLGLLLVWSIFMLLVKMNPASL